MRWLASSRAALGVARWASRVAVALVFVLGMLATASTTRVESESDLSVEAGEDGEIAEQVNVHASTTRRPGSVVGAASRPVHEPPAPRRLDPRRAPPQRKSRLGPRRTAPPDDDDESLA